MGRNHKKVTLQAVELAKELKLDLSFNNYVNGEFLKPYMTEVKINSHVIKGLQAWDNKDFNNFMLAIKEFVTKEDITGHSLKTVDDIREYMNATKTSVSRHRKEDGQSHVEYAKDSYRWAQIDIIDRFCQYQEIDTLYKRYAFDDMETTEQYMDKLQSMQEFFKAYYIKMNKCMPDANFWTAERLESFYITSKILPKFIREELKATVSDSDMSMICQMYMKARDIDCKSFNTEMFADNLHRLIGDTQVKDDLFSRMGY